MTEPIPIPEATAAPVANFIAQFNGIMEEIPTVPSRIDGAQTVYVDSMADQEPLPRFIDMTGKINVAMEKHGEVSAALKGRAEDQEDRMSSVDEVEVATSPLFSGISYVKGFFDLTVERVMRGENGRSEDSFPSKDSRASYAARMSGFEDLRVGNFPMGPGQENYLEDRRAIADDAFISSQHADDPRTTLPYLFASAILYAGLTDDGEAVEKAAVNFFGSAKVLSDMRKDIPAAIVAEFAADLSEGRAHGTVGYRLFAAEAWLRALDLFEDYQGNIIDRAGFLMANFRGLWNASRQRSQHDSDPLIGHLGKSVSFNQRRGNNKVAAEDALRVMRARLVSGDHGDREHWRRVAADLSHAVAIWYKSNRDPEIFEVLLGLVAQSKEITAALA